MRILIVSFFFPPLNSIASERPYSWAKYWSKEGHDVVVLTTEKTCATEVYENMTGYQVCEVPNPALIKKFKKDYSSLQNTKDSPSRKSIVKTLFNKMDDLREKKGILASCRMPDLSDLCIHKMIKKGSLLGNFDCIVSTAGPYAAHVIARTLKKRNIAPVWVADYRDLWVDSHIFPGIFPFNLFEKWLEPKLISYADRITTVSSPLAQVLGKKYPHVSVNVIENGYEPEDIDQLPVESIFPQDDMFRLVYTGKIYPGKRDPSPLFQAIASISQDVQNRSLLNGLKVVFAGTSLSYVDRLSEKYKVEPWIENVGFKTREDALRMQRDANGLLFLEWADPNANGVYTGKIFEYLSAKRPIWAIGITMDNVAAKLIEKLNAGIVFGDDANKIKNKLLEQLESKKKSSTCFLDNALVPYQRKTLALKMLDLITEKS